MTATDPTPQPATHASGPRAGQPVEAPPTAPVVVLEDALCRRVWAAALRWKAGQLRDDAEHQRHTGQTDAADASRYYASALEIDAHRIETGELTPWADQPEPPAQPAQPAGDATAAAGPTPGTTGPAILGRALIDRDGDIWPMRADGSYGSGHPRDYFDDAYGPVREVLLVDPSAGRVLDAVGQWRRACCDGDDPALWADGADLALIAAWDALGEPAPDDQRRCPATHPAHGQCELHQGHRPAGDPDRRHRTGPLSWLTDAEIQACGLPPLASYAGTAAELAGKDHASSTRQTADQPERPDAPDLQSGPANESGEPAADLAGDGWARRPLLELAEWLETGPAETRDPDIGRQVRALLADRDLYVGALDTRSTQLYDALAERDAARGELDAALRILAHGVRVQKMLEGERDAARAELAETVEANHRWAADHAELTAELAVVVADRGSHRVASSRLAVRLAGATGDVERLRAEVARLEEELVGARSECDRELATARRDAAADFGAWLAKEIRRLSGRINVPQWILGRAGEIRAGTRPVPGSPEPATTPTETEGP
jgi:hypothetical protein